MAATFYHPPYAKLLLGLLLSGGDQPHFYFNYPAAENEFSCTMVRRATSSRDMATLRTFPEIGDEGIRVVL